MSSSARHFNGTVSAHIGAGCQAAVLEQWASVGAGATSRVARPVRALPLEWLVVDGSPGTPRIERGGLALLGPLLRAASCQRVLVITGPGARHAARLEHELAGFERQTFSEARRHVPSVLVERAVGVLGAFGADAVVTVGGGSATGLGKALRLERQFYFVAAPTTYAGSELTDLYGTTSAAGKRTGRDARVVPDVALYDVDLMLDMPVALSITSLLNAFAHPASALSTGKLDGAGTERALAAAAAVYSALQRLGADCRDLEGRRAAIDGTVLSGTVLRTSAVGLHHELAHALGGRFDLDHAGLHGVLLPYTVAALAHTAPTAFETLQRRVGDAQLPRRLLAILQSAGVAASLAALGVTRAGLEQLLGERPHWPRELLERAFAGAEP